MNINFMNFLDMEPGWVEILLRLAVAMLVGLVIGTEREYTNRPAGMRTHILVSLGACVVAIIGVLISEQYQDPSDPARLGAQVISGVGFLGAGTILRDGTNVRGLTTAASLWAVGCLGLATGFGYYLLALVGMVFIFITLTILEVVQNKFMNTYSTTLHYCLETNDISAILNRLNEDAASEQATVLNLQATQLPDGAYRVTFSAKFGGGRGKQRHQQFFQTLVTAPEVRSLFQTDGAAVHK